MYARVIGDKNDACEIDSTRGSDTRVMKDIEFPEAQMDTIPLTWKPLSAKKSFPY